MTGNNSLTRNQKRALAALLEYSTVVDAAKACGLSEKTMFRYLEKDHFRAALNQAESDRIGEAGRRLVAGQEEALNTLETMITDQNAKDTDRRLAAIAWLDYLLRYRELRNIEERLTVLEGTVYGEKNRYSY